jgi:TfoX/Sxy family transcriptional regulator of competence genes
MAYNAGLADDIRSRIGNRTDLTEREMFGGIAFMVGGNMAVGVSGDDLMVRVGKETYDEALTRPGVREFDMSGRPMRGWVLVSDKGYSTEGDLTSWIDRGVSYAESLPPK